MLALERDCEVRPTYLQCCPYGANLAPVVAVVADAAILTVNTISRVVGPTVFSVALPATAAEPDTIAIANETQHSINITSGGIVKAVLAPGTTQTFTYQGNAFALS